MMGSRGRACPHLAQEGFFRGFRCLVGVCAGVVPGDCGASTGISVGGGKLVLSAEDEVRVEPGGLRVGLCVGRDSMSSLVWSNAAAFSRCGRIG